jgi:hypothetical protein
MCIYWKIQKCVHVYTVCVCEPHTKPKNSAWFAWPQWQLFMQENPTSLVSFDTWESHLLSCRFRSEVCYLFSKKTHVQQKVALFMGHGPSFFQKAGFEKYWVFSTGGHQEHMVRIQVEIKNQSSKAIKVSLIYSNTWHGVKSVSYTVKVNPAHWISISSPTKGDSRILVMKMVSSMLYWLTETMIGLYV